MFAFLVAYVWLTFIFTKSSDFSLQSLILYVNSSGVSSAACFLRTFKTQTPTLQYIVITIIGKHWDCVPNCSIALNTSYWKLWFYGKTRFVSVQYSEILQHIANETPSLLPW